LLDRFALVPAGAQLGDRLRSRRGHPCTIDKSVRKLDLPGVLTQSMRARYEAAHDEGRPLLGGHRGNPAENPENTMRSFRSAIAIGCDLIECDVHLSADGRLVVIHDHTLDRTTNGSGLVRDHSAAELRKLDAGDGEKIPLLQEVVELALG